RARAPEIIPRLRHRVFLERLERLDGILRGIRRNPELRERQRIESRVAEHRPQLAQLSRTARRQQELHAPASAFTCAASRSSIARTAAAISRSSCARSN